MRQYAIFYRRGNAADFSRLNAKDHGNLVGRDEVQQTVELMRQRPFLEGACVRIDDELFNIVSFTQDAIAPDSFQFEASP